jgi:hypothetical protein
LINETAFNKKMLICSEFDIKKLALVIKRNQNIWIFHRLVEIIKFGSIVFLLFFFNLLFLLLGYILLLIFKQDRLVDFDAVLTFSIRSYEEIERTWQLNISILVRALF